MLAEALPLMEKVLGQRHSDVLAAMSDLAKVLKSQGKPWDALGWEEKVLVGLRSLRGETHSETLEAIDALATTFAEIGKVEEAKRQRKEALEIRRRELGMITPIRRPPSPNCSVYWPKLETCRLLRQVAPGMANTCAARSALPKAIS